MKIKVVYSDKQVSDTGLQPLVEKGYTASPSANKPKEVAAALRSSNLDVEFVEPIPLTIDDFKLAHNPDYVDGVMSLKLENGFGTYSQSVADSLPYTNGAQYTAAKLATPDQPTCALVSGFHHAGYNTWKGLGWFCTFNGLMITAAKLVAEGKKVFILDCDMHWGNGTDDILNKLPELKKFVRHLSFGKYFTNPIAHKAYLKWLEEDGTVTQLINDKEFGADVILYQAGADVHKDDPYGGVLTTEQIYERDLRVFKIAKKLGIPICWNLAGGYQVGPDGNIDKVLELHINTFKACSEVYKNDNPC